MSKIAIKTFTRQSGATTKLVKKFLKYNSTNKDNSILVFSDKQQMKKALENFSGLKKFESQIIPMVGSKNFFSDKNFIDKKVFADCSNSKLIKNFVSSSLEFNSDLLIHVSKD